MDKILNKDLDNDSQGSRGSRQSTPTEMYRGGEKPVPTVDKILTSSETRTKKLMQRKDWRNAITKARYPDFKQDMTTADAGSAGLQIGHPHIGEDGNGNGGNGGGGGGLRSDTKKKKGDLSRQVTPLHLYKDGARYTPTGERSPTQIKQIKELKPAAGRKIERFQQIARQQLERYDEDALMEEYMMQESGEESEDDEEGEDDGGDEVDDATSEHRREMRELEESRVRARVEKGIEKLKGLVGKKTAPSPAKEVDPPQERFVID